MTKWTNKKPTVPGWYWWKKSETSLAIIAQIQDSPSGLFLSASGILVNGIEPIGIWSSRIPEPK